MADFSKVVDKLAENNQTENSRAETLNESINTLRTSNEKNLNAFIASEKENKASQVEKGKEDNFQDEKQITILEKLSAGIGGLKNATMAGIDKVKGSGLFKMLKGTLLAGLMFAIAGFFQSDLFPKLIDVITNKILPKLMVVYEFFKGKFAKFFEDLGTFLDDPSFTNLSSLIMDNKVALLTLTALLAPKTFMKVLRLGFLALKGATVFLGNELMKDAKGVRFGKSKGMFTKVFDFIKTKISSIGAIIGVIGAKFTAIGAAITGFTGIALAPLALIVAGFVAVGYALYESFKAFTKRFEETGSIGESIKASISTFLGTLIALPATLIQKIIGFFAGLFGFDQFKAKIESFDFAGEVSKAIENGINYVINFFKKLPEQIGAFFTKYIGPDAQWAKDIQQSLTDFFAPIFNFDFSALLGDLLGKAGKVGKKIASLFGFGDKEEVQQKPVEQRVQDIKDASAKALAAQKKIQKEGMATFEKLGGGAPSKLQMVEEEKQSLQKRIAQLETQKSSRAMRELKVREQQLDALNKSAIAKAAGGDEASVNVVAPQAKVTNNNANTNVSTTSYVGNPDMAFKLAAGT